MKLSLARQNNTQLELLHVAFTLLRPTELAEFNLGLVKESGVTNSIISRTRYLVLFHFFEQKQNHLALLAYNFFFFAWP